MPLAKRSRRGKNKQSDINTSASNTVSSVNKSTTSFSIKEVISSMAREDATLQDSYKVNK